MSAPSNENREERLLDLATRADGALPAAGEKDPELSNMREGWDQLRQLLDARSAARPIAEMQLVSEIRLRLSRRRAKRWTIGVGFAATAAAALVIAFLQWIPMPKLDFAPDKDAPKVVNADSKVEAQKSLPDMPPTWNEDVDSDLAYANALCLETLSDMHKSPERSSQVGLQLRILGYELNFSDL